MTIIKGVDLDEDCNAAMYEPGVLKLSCVSGMTMSQIQVSAFDADFQVAFTWAVLNDKF